MRVTQYCWGSTRSLWSKVFSGSWVALHLLPTGTLGEKPLVHGARLRHCLLSSGEAVTNCPPCKL